MTHDNEVERLIKIIQDAENGRRYHSHSEAAMSAIALNDTELAQDFGFQTMREAFDRIKTDKKMIEAIERWTGRPFKSIPGKPGRPKVYKSKQEADRLRQQRRKEKLLTKSEAFDRVEEILKSVSHAKKMKKEDLISVIHEIQAAMQ